MIGMVNVMNKNFFGGQRVLTCYTCHRGSTTPETTPDLTQFYSTLRYREPDRFVNPFPGAPPKFVRAVVYDYSFTNFAERRTTGQWWKREWKGVYLRAISLADVMGRE